ncbi:hypothetical protein ACO0SA_003034 [Hanseniaspora valbyensis]
MQMKTTVSYTKKKHIQIHFDCLPSNYSTVIIKKKKLQEKYDNEIEGLIDCDKIRMEYFMLSVGTVFAKGQGCSDGCLYYNESKQLQKEKKYGLYCLEEVDGFLRIDFLSLDDNIYNENCSIVPPNLASSNDLEETIVDTESQFAFNSVNKNKLNSINQDMKLNEKEFQNTVHSSSDISNSNYKVPLMVFRGSKLKFLTNRKTPFIGVVEFI